MNEEEFEDDFNGEPDENSEIESEEFTDEEESDEEGILG